MAGVMVGWQQGDDKPHLAKEQHGPSRHRTQCNGCGQVTLFQYAEQTTSTGTRLHAIKTLRATRPVQRRQAGEPPPLRLWQ
eukprot:gene18799-biopygen20473